MTGLLMSTTITNPTDQDWQKFNFYIIKLVKYVKHFNSNGQRKFQYFIRNRTEQAKIEIDLYKYDLSLFNKWYFKKYGTEN